MVNCNPTYFLNISKTTSNIQQNTHYVSIFLLIYFLFISSLLYFFQCIFRILRNVSGLPPRKQKVGFHVTQRCCFNLVCRWQYPQKLPIPECSRNNQFLLSSEGNVSKRTTSRCLLSAAHDRCCSAAARLPSAGFLQLFTLTRISILPHSQPKPCKMSPLWPPLPSCLNDTWLFCIQASNQWHRENLRSSLVCPSGCKFAKLPFNKHSFYTVGGYMRLESWFAIHQFKTEREHCRIRRRRNSSKNKIPQW